MYPAYLLGCVLGNSHVLQQVGWMLLSADSWDRSIWNHLNSGQYFKLVSVGGEKHDLFHCMQNPGWQNQTVHTHT